MKTFFTLILGLLLVGSSFAQQTLRSSGPSLTSKSSSSNFPCLDVPTTSCNTSSTGWQRVKNFFRRIYGPFKGAL